MKDLFFQVFYNLGIPRLFVELAWTVVPFVCTAVLLMLVVLYLILMERKVLAWLTIRKGPNRVGYCGFFQTIADAIKLLCKEDIMSKDTNKVLFTIAPIVVFFPIMVVYGLMPFTEKFIAIDLAAGIFMVFALSSLTTVGIVLAGWASNNKYSLLGGMRSAAQAISYELPLIVSALSVVVLAGSMNLSSIIAAQSGGVSSALILNWNILSWNIIPSFIGFIVFFICSIAEVNRVPFDLPEAESELVSGYNTEYSGMKFALFFLAEYSSLFIMSVFTVVLFLGGYLSPFNDYLSVFLLENLINNNTILGLFIHLEQGFWIIAKTYFVILLIMWIRATLPRLRTDQLMSFAWKFLLPLSLFNLTLVSVFKYFANSI